jgi:hypothetical protein
MPDDTPQPYRLSDDPPPKRKYRPMPGVRASSEREPDEFDQPVLKRFLGTDPFPWALALCAVVWIGLGLGTRVWVGCAGVLVVAGVVTVILSQLWLCLSIYEDDRVSGFLALVSDWFRSMYLHMYPQLAWRPTLLAVVGLLMMFTGVGLGVDGFRRR